MGRKAKPKHSAIDPSTINQKMNMAIRYHQHGQLDQADALYLDVLRMVPELPEALQLRGLIACQQRQFQRAIPLLRKAVKARPDYVDARINLGNAYKETVKLDAALEQYSAALKLAPTRPDAHNNIGAVLKDQGRLSDALSHYQQALQIDPDSPLTRYNLGNTLLDANELESATEHLEIAIKLAPDYADPHIALGNVLQKQHKNVEAIEQYRKGLELNPDSVPGWTQLGIVFLDMNRAEKARQCFHNALNVEPDNLLTKIHMADALSQTGQTRRATELLDQALAPTDKSAELCHLISRTFKNLGRHKEAEHYIRKALKMAPAHTSYHGELAQLRKFSAENENDLRCAREMESILERDREADANATLHFALGKIYTDLKQYDASFQHYLDANRLTRKTFEYSPDQTTEFVDRTIKAYPPTLFDRLESLAAASDLPVFILGMPRSGTTLTEQIISSHPDVAGAGELGDIGRMAEALSKFLGSDLHYPECIAQLNPSTVSAYVDRYIQELRSISSNALRITDKMPGNFKYAGLIALLFKNIRIVHTARNPIDTCISIFFQNFKGFHPYAYDLYELGLYYREYHRLMEHWKTVLPVKIHESRYEDLIADPEYYSRQLIDYVGLPWDDQCLRFHETKRVVQTASHWQVRQPIYKSSSQRWKRYDKFLGPLKEGLGDLARED